MIIAVPDTTEFEWLAWAIGPVASGKIRIIAIAAPSNVPSRIMATKVLVSISLLENLRTKTRAIKIKVAHMALAQIGFASPADAMTMADESQTAIASELSRKSN